MLIKTEITADMSRLLFSIVTYIAARSAIQRHLDDLGRRMLRSEKFVRTEKAVLLQVFK